MAITRNLSIFLHRREWYGTYLYFLLLEPLFGLRWIVRLHHEAEKETTDQPSHYSTAQIQFFILFHLPPEPRFDLLSAALHPYLDISQLKIGVQYRAHGKCMCMYRGLPATCSSTWKKRWVISDSQVANPNNWRLQAKHAHSRSLWRMSFRLDELGHGLCVYFVLLSCTTEPPMLPHRLE